MKSKLIRNYLIITSLLIVLALSGFFAMNNTLNLKKILGSGKINIKNDSKSDDVKLTFDDSSKNYIKFSLEKKESNISYYLNLDFLLSKISEEYKDKEIKLKLEKSLDGDEYIDVKESLLELSNKNIILDSTNEYIENGKTYYRISFFTDNDLLKIEDDNFYGDLKISTTMKFNYAFNEGSQEFKAPLDGKYRIELWGAKGNYYKNTNGINSGDGAYTAGTITLEKEKKLYINIGKNSTDGNEWYQQSIGGGGAGGGCVKADNGDCLIYDPSNSNYQNYHYGASGGGATDIRLIDGSWNDEHGLNSRIMVAAGGGGSLYKTGSGVFKEGCSGTGGAGGGLVGYPGQIAYLTNNYEIFSNEQKQISDAIISRYPTGGTQTTGGTVGKSLDVESYNYTNWKYIQFLDENMQFNQGSFGIGGAGFRKRNNPEKAVFALSTLSAGAGGGYYGGSGNAQSIVLGSEAKNFNEEVPGHTSAAGGSSFISGHTGSIAVISENDNSPKEGCIESGNIPNNYVGTDDNSCSIHYSNLVFEDTVMIDGMGYSWSNKKDGLAQMPNPDGGYYELGKGHDKSGAARITLLSSDDSVAANWEKIYVDDEKNDDKEKEPIIKHTVKITVMYKDTNGNIIYPTNIIDNLDGKTTYYTDEKNIDGYRLVEKPNNSRGLFPDKDITLIYVYEKIDIENPKTYDNVLYFSSFGLVFLITTLIFMVKYKKLDNLM